MWLSPSGQVAHTTLDWRLCRTRIFKCPLGLIHHFYGTYDIYYGQYCGNSVNALSGLYIISTTLHLGTLLMSRVQCQCPLGLIHHFYSMVRVYDRRLLGCVNALSGLYIISTRFIIWRVESEGLCQCPLGLIHHFYF